MIKIFINYDRYVMTSYDYYDWIEEKFGEEGIRTLSEIRNPQGVLQGFEIFIRARIN